MVRGTRYAVKIIVYKKFMTILVAARRFAVRGENNCITFMTILVIVAGYAVHVENKCVSFMTILGNGNDDANGKEQ